MTFKLYFTAIEVEQFFDRKINLVTKNDMTAHYKTLGYWHVTAL